MSQNQPLVSVVIPAYNHEQYVERAIRSVLEQTYPNIELIVVDDGSPDNTLAVIERVRRESTKDFTIIAKQNGGVSSALNAGVAASHGEFIALLASDDWFKPEKTARQVAQFAAAGPRMGMVHTSGVQQAEDNRAVVSLQGSYKPAEGFCFRELVARDVTALAPSVMIRRTVFDEVGGFDEQLVGEDLDFYAAIAARGYSIGFDPTEQIVKSARGDNLANKVELFFNDPFVTLSKYRSRFTPEEYVAMEDGFYAGMGRAAAGVGNVVTSWQLYVTLARRRHSPLPLAEFASRNLRHLALSSIPFSWRAYLRRKRALLRTAMTGNG